jgi:cyanophycinase
VTGLLRYRNSIWRSFFLVSFPSISDWRPFLASLVGIVLGCSSALAAEKIEAPRAAPSDIRGFLVIVGGGDFPDVIRDRFLELAGGKKGRLVVIPTASAVADQTRIRRSYDYWQAQGLQSVEMLHTLDAKKANDPSFVKPLTEATAAWLGGGDQLRLSRAYHGTAVERELRRLVARGGVIGGTSAGASVMSSVMITGGNPKARIGEGFGLLPDVVIDQHFQNRRRKDRLLGVLADHPRCLGLGIDEATAVVVHGHTFTVMGRANVSICLPPSEQDHGDVKLLKSNEVGDLLQLSRNVMARLHVPSESKPSVAKTTRATTP